MHVLACWFFFILLFCFILFWCSLEYYYYHHYFWNIINKNSAIRCLHLFNSLLSQRLTSELFWSKSVSVVSRPCKLFCHFLQNHLANFIQLGTVHPWVKGIQVWVPLDSVSCWTLFLRWALWSIVHILRNCQGQSDLCTASLGSKWVACRFG